MQNPFQSPIALMLLLMLNASCHNPQRKGTAHNEHYLDSLLSTEAVIALAQLPEHPEKLISDHYEQDLFEQIKDKRYLFLPDRHTENLSMEETIQLIPSLKEIWGMEALAIEVPNSKQMYFDELNRATDPDIVEYILNHIETMFDLNIISKAQAARKMIATCKSNNINVYAINLPEKADTEKTDFNAVYDVIDKHFSMHQTKASFTKQMEVIDQIPIAKRSGDAHFQVVQNQFMAAVIKELNESKVAVWVGSAHTAPMTTFAEKNQAKLYCNSTRRLLGLHQSTSLYFMGNQDKGYYHMPNILEGICISTGTANKANTDWKYSLLKRLQRQVPEISKQPFEPIKQDHKKVIELAARINHAVSGH